MRLRDFQESQNIYKILQEIPRFFTFSSDLFNFMKLPTFYFSILLLFLASALNLLSFPRSYCNNVFLYLKKIYHYFFVDLILILLFRFLLKIYQVFVILK